YGVTVLGWKCSEMPAFYSRSSGLAVDQRVDDAASAARVALARDALGLDGAVLVTVPVPREFEISREELEETLSDALASADERGVTGKEITPYLLSQMSERSGGRTLAANIALLEHNACIAAEIAFAMSRLT